MLRRIWSRRTSGLGALRQGLEQEVRLHDWVSMLKEGSCIWDMDAAGVLKLSSSLSSHNYNSKREHGSYA